MQEKVSKRETLELAHCIQSTLYRNIDANIKKHPFLFNIDKSIIYEFNQTHYDESFCEDLYLPKYIDKILNVIFINFLFLIFFSLKRFLKSII